MELSQRLWAPGFLFLPAFVWWLHFGARSSGMPLLTPQRTRQLLEILQIFSRIVHRPLCRHRSVSTFWISDVELGTVFLALYAAKTLQMTWELETPL